MSAIDVKRGLLIEIGRRQPLLLVVSAAAGIVVARFYADKMPGSWLVAWLCLLLSVQLVRGVVWWTLRRNEWQASTFALEWWICGLSFFGGLGWGGFGLMMAAIEVAPMHFLGALVMVGLIAGAAISYSGHFACFLLFAVPTLLPSGIVLVFFIGDEALQAIGSMTLIFLIGMTIATASMHRNVKRSLIAADEKRALVEQLQQARDELEERVRERTRDLHEANAALAREVDERRSAEIRVRELLVHDPLTGLPNRILFKDRLDRGVAQAQRRRERLGVMMLDLDHFKSVNDTAGHPAGDAVLREAASRLRAAVRASDTVARLSGDEFAVILPGLGERADLVTLAERIIEATNQPLTYERHVFSISFSIGAALFPDAAEDPEGLLAAADRALYQSKEAGRARFSLLMTPIES